MGDRRNNTEAQWERGAQDLLGDDTYGEDRIKGRPMDISLNRETAREVCSEPENGFGLCDMAGQIYEKNPQSYTRSD